MSPHNTIERTRGDDWRITGTVGPAGAPLDLTGCTIHAQLRRTADSPDAHDFAVEIIDATGGRIALVMAAGVTATLDATEHVYDIEVVDAAGKRLTYGRGYKIQVRVDATRVTP